MTDDPSNLAQRLDRLERLNRRLSGIAGMLVAGFVLLLMWQLMPRPEIEAQRFMLRDQQGRWRGALMVSSDGSPVLRLNGRDAKPRFFAVAPFEGGVRLRLTDSLGYHRAQLDVAASNGTAFLRLNAADGSRHAEIAVARNGYAYTSLLDTAGTRIPWTP